MRWYEYKMEADDLHAPEDLKAKLLAMADTLPEEEKNRPMMPAQADNTAVVRPQEPLKKAKLIHFPAKQVGALAACLAVCVVGYGALSTGKLDIGAKSSNMALYSANSSAASTAGGFTTQQAMLDATPEAVTYDLDQAAVLSENDAAAAEDRQASTSPKIIYTANLTLESKDYDTARAALDAALNDAGGYLESSSEYSDVGISRSAFYKYRDAVRPFNDMKTGRIITFYTMLKNNPGVLSDVLSIFAGSGANILTINQSIPTNGCAAVTISAETSEMQESIEEMMARALALEGVVRFDILAA